MTPASVYWAPSSPDLSHSGLSSHDSGCSWRVIALRPITRHPRAQPLRCLLLCYNARQYGPVRSQRSRQCQRQFNTRWAKRGQLTETLTAHTIAQRSMRRAIVLVWAPYDTARSSARRGIYSGGHNASHAHLWRTDGDSLGCLSPSRWSIASATMEAWSSTRDRCGSQVSGSGLRSRVMKPHEHPLVGVEDCRKVQRRPEGMERSPGHRRHRGHAPIWRSSARSPCRSC
jgi:hypothetical protein